MGWAADRTTRRQSNAFSESKGEPSRRASCLSCPTSIPREVSVRQSRTRSTGWPRNSGQDRSRSSCLPVSRPVPLGSYGERELIGVRNPDSRFLQLLMQMIPGPVVSTSAEYLRRAAKRAGSGTEEAAGGRSGFVCRWRGCGGGGAVDGGRFEPVSPPRVVRVGALAQRVEEAIANL